MFEILYKIALLFLICLCFFARRFILSLPSLIYWWICDLTHYDKRLFREYGLTLFCGKQGAGKTVGMVHELERLRRRYPHCKIYTNFGYMAETAPLKSLNDLLDKSLLNGTDGVIFAIDEIQNEFSSSVSTNLSLVYRLKTVLHSTIV